MKKDKLLFYFDFMHADGLCLPNVKPETTGSSELCRHHQLVSTGKMTFDKKTDVFYIAPTCIWDWKNDQGDTLHHMDIKNKKQRLMLTPSILLGKRVFADSW